MGTKSKSSLVVSRGYLRSLFGIPGGRFCPFYGVEVALRYPLFLSHIRSLASPSGILCFRFSCGPSSPPRARETLGKGLGHFHLHLHLHLHLNLHLHQHRTSISTSTSTSATVYVHDHDTKSGYYCCTPPLSPPFLSPSFSTHLPSYPLTPPPLSPILLSLLSTIPHPPKDVPAQARQQLTQASNRQQMTKA